MDTPFVIAPMHIPILTSRYRNSFIDILILFSHSVSKIYELLLRDMRDINALLSHMKLFIHLFHHKSHW